MSKKGNNFKNMKEPASGDYLLIVDKSLNCLPITSANLSKKNDAPISRLVNIFGRHLDPVFKKSHTNFLNQPDAERSKFEYDELSENVLVLSQPYTHPFADLAERLIIEAVEYYDEKVNLISEDRSGGKNTSRKFTLERM